MHSNGKHHSPRRPLTSEELVIYVNRSTGEMGMPIFWAGEFEQPEWQLLPIAHLGPRSMWRPGCRKVQGAIKAGVLPAG